MSIGIGLHGRLAVLRMMCPFDKGRNLKLEIPKLPKVTYELPLELKNRLDDSILVHSKRLS